MFPSPSTPSLKYSVSPLLTCYFSSQHSLTLTDFSMPELTSTDLRPDPPFEIQAWNAYMVSGLKPKLQLNIIWANNASPPSFAPIRTLASHQHLLLSHLGPLPSIMIITSRSLISCWWSFPYCHTKWSKTTRYANGETNKRREGRRCQTDEVKPFLINTRANTRHWGSRLSQHEDRTPLKRKTWRPKENRSTTKSRQHDEKTQKEWDAPMHNRKLEGQ